MIEIVAFDVEHAKAIELQASQLHWMGRFTASYLRALGSAGVAYSALSGATVLGCAGIVDCGLGTGLLWALAHKDAGRHFVPLFRAVERLITLVPLRRLEATCERAFKPGCRALEMLDFQFEGLMKSYGPDGQDHYRYARIS